MKFDNFTNLSFNVCITTFGQNQVGFVLNIHKVVYLFSAHMFFFSNSKLNATKIDIMQLRVELSNSLIFSCKLIDFNELIIIETVHIKHKLPLIFHYQNWAFCV